MASTTCPTMPNIQTFVRLFLRSSSLASTVNVFYSIYKIELSRVDRFAGTMILFWPFGMFKLIIMESLRL